MTSGKLLEGSRASFSPMRSSLALLLSSPSRAPRNSLLMSEITRRTDHAAPTLASKLCGILSDLRTVTLTRTHCHRFAHRITKEKAQPQDEVGLSTVYYPPMMTTTARRTSRRDRSS